MINLFLFGLLILLFYFRKIFQFTLMIYGLGLLIFYVYILIFLDIKGQAEYEVSAIGINIMYYGLPIILIILLSFLLEIRKYFLKKNH